MKEEPHQTKSQLDDIYEQYFRNVVAKQCPIIGWIGMPAGVILVVLAFTSNQGADPKTLVISGIVLFIVSLIVLIGGRALEKRLQK